MTKVIVVIPSYFDLKSAHEIFHELEKSLFRFDLQTIVIDESLGQESFQCDRDCSLRVVIPTQRLGQQRQLIHFFRSIATVLSALELKSSIIVVMDADGEDNPQHVLTLLDSLQTNPVDTVIAKRLGRKTTYRFKIGYTAFKLFSRVLTGKWLTSGSFSASHSAWLVNEIHNPVFSYSFAGGLLGSSGSKTFVPLNRSFRRYGTSRVNTNKLILHGLDFLLAQVSVITARLFLLFSAGSVLGFIAITSAVTGKIQGWASEGWATFLILGSLQICILLGVIFLISFVQYGFQNNHIQRTVSYTFKK